MNDRLREQDPANVTFELDSHIVGVDDKTDLQILSQNEPHVDTNPASFPIPIEYFKLDGPKVSKSDPDELIALPPRRRRIAAGLARLLGHPATTEEYESPEYGFREYLLFALKTRILPPLQRLLGREVLVSFTGFPGANLILSFTASREPHLTSDMRKEVEALIKSETVDISATRRMECLVLSSSSVHYLAPQPSHAVRGPDGLYHRIPSRWVRAILQFVPADRGMIIDQDMPVVVYRVAKYDHELRTARDEPVPNGGGGLYIDCFFTTGVGAGDGGEHYKDSFSRISETILSVIRRWYDEGRVVDVDPSVARKWRLEGYLTIKHPMGRSSSTLFRPIDNWGLTRITQGLLVDMPVSALLWEIAKGQMRQVAIRVGVNLVDYHELTKRLFSGGVGEVARRHKGFHFANGSLHYTPRDLDDLLSVLEGVDDVLYGDSIEVPDAATAVVTLYATRYSWIRVISLLLRRSVSPDVTVYVRKDIDPVFVISAAVPDETNVEFLRTELFQRARRLMVYLKDKFEEEREERDVDVHSLLDDVKTELPPDLSSPTVREHIKARWPELDEAPKPLSELVKRIQF